MKIIILGAGQVGSSVAANLVSEANDITIVDVNAKLLQSLSERFDLQSQRTTIFLLQSTEKGRFALLIRR